MVISQMTQQHFQEIAKIVKDSTDAIGVRDSDDAEGVIDPDVLANNLADYFATQNARFNTVKFMSGCGLEFKPPTDLSGAEE